MHSRSLFVFAACAALSLPAAAQHPADASAEKPAANLVEVATRAGSFQTLLQAAAAAGLVDTLQSKGPFTVFAPTDAAFEALPEGTVAKLLEQPEKLKAILLYHVVPGRIMAKDLKGKEWAPTAQGQSLRVQTNDGVTIDAAKVQKADIAASNGMIHVIDSVLMPRGDRVEVATEAGAFEKLLAAAKAADLVETLRGEGPFTVFAPTDAAFAKLPDGTLDDLLAQPEKLKAILLYHVVPGRVLAQDIPMSDGDAPSIEAGTVQGQKLTIIRTDRGVTVGGAKVARADALAGNGVIHVIDSVLLPPAGTDH